MINLKHIVVICLHICQLHTFAQADCFNTIEIKQLGVEFCLPDSEWRIEDIDGLKFITINRSGLYLGTNSYTIRVEKISENLTSREYFEVDKSERQDVDGYNEIVVKEGARNINGKEFYFSKTHTVYKSKDVVRNSYAVTYFYCKDKIGYALSHVVDDENKDL